MTQRVVIRRLAGACLVLMFVVTSCRTVETPQPGLPDLEPGVWNTFIPGGDTVCADGSEYRYFVHPGTVNRLVIDFMGGGACWDYETCSNPGGPGVGGGFYWNRIWATPDGFPGFDGFPGIYDRSNENNPFRDWYHLFISYCTGDLHAGDASHIYRGPGDDVTVDHRGAVNATAALEWAFEEFEAPESIFVTGCSAGAYGSIIWLPEIARRYPASNLYQLADCGAGIITDSFAASGLPNWNIDATLARIPNLGDLGDPLPTDLLPRAYRAIGQSFPDATLSQYNTLFDGVQISFYQQMGGDPLLWSGKMLEALDDIAEETENFTSYTAFYDFDNNSGTPHCIVIDNDFYSVETEGVKLVDWVAELIEGEPVPPVAPLSNDTSTYLTP